MSVAKGFYTPDGQVTGEKIVLERTDEMWGQLADGWANADPLQTRFRTKALAMAILRFVAGWPLERIGLAFGQHRGRVLRSITRCGELIRAECEPRAVAPPVDEPTASCDEWSERETHSANR